MSVANVRQIRVTNHGPAAAVPSIVVGVNNHDLQPAGNLGAGATRTYNLDLVHGINSGNLFHARVTIPQTGADGNDNNRLTFVAGANFRAIYVIVGTADVPHIAYQGLEQI